MRIAIIGWGSLIWDLEILAPQVAGDWRMGAGPMFPLEFSRISPKRKMGLAVCLDPENGDQCPTHAIASIRDVLEEAVEDLAARERAPVSRIGWATAQESFGRLAPVNDLAMAWCAASDEFDACLWTDLEPNFEEREGIPFTVPDAIAYLRTLDAEQIEEAHLYIEEAPPATDTPLRRALDEDAWWRGLRSARG
ncbi:hypothetical protein [Roseobacter sp. HKCCA0434]|uniref:hypothetical protein n=1 Tax=Roseobacter sp. HKCCA0434 TaxID=3079297 RepID=UPI002905B9AC|nr:hypothetical protein [Roseobacter sp. HKCCA0434]